MCDPFIHRVGDTTMRESPIIKAASVLIVVAFFSLTTFTCQNEKPKSDSKPDADAGTDMCLICVEFEKERLTVFEARRNLGEMTDLDKEHVREVEAMLNEAEQDDESNDGAPAKGAYD